jgi:erythromycin esterase-like protein
LAGSVEDLFYASGPERFLALLPKDSRLSAALRVPLLERAIGVIYRPETERQSHYFYSKVAEQFDAVIHINETRAVEPLERTGEWEIGEPAETFPRGV